jgi:MoxR-like ATPase
MIYFAPNPRVNSTELSFIIFTKLANKILDSAPTYEVRFSDFCNEYCGTNGSVDIMENGLTNALELVDFLEFSRTNRSFKLRDPSERVQLENLVTFIETNFQIPDDPNDKHAFFERFSCENFKKMLSFFDESFTFVCDNIMKYNRILYGAPGTGKSYILQKNARCSFDIDKIERINFYNGYTYGQFVGSYKPKPVYKEGTNFYHDLATYTIGNLSEPYITYEYVPGIFLTILLQAIQNKNHNYCLIIEEINRTKVDTVFGDMFQLLDRDGTGKSEYRVKCSNEMLAYIQNSALVQADIDDIESSGIYIPNNLYLWATMNSADQGVFPMDTAFKRRWSFEYIGLDKGESEMDEFEVEIQTLRITWNKFRKSINHILATNYSISEDKLLAPFFVKPKDFDDKKLLDKNVFINKIVMYIKEDVLRHRNEDKIFNENRFSKIAEKYENGENIFTPDFLAILTN